MDRHVEPGQQVGEAAVVIGMGMRHGDCSERLVERIDARPQRPRVGHGEQGIDDDNRVATLQNVGVDRCATGGAGMTMDERKGHAEQTSPTGTP